jgi:hypothetical protein
VDSVHRLFRASSDLRDDSGNALVTAYAVERPDGQWSLMLINKDQGNDYTVRVTFADADGASPWHFTGTVERITFGSAEYQWHADKDGSGHADPDGPPSKSNVSGGDAATYLLPKASIVVLRGRLGGSAQK